jgi:hypothetical protein
LEIAAAATAHLEVLLQSIHMVAHFFLSSKIPVARKQATTLEIAALFRLLSRYLL